ncbi:MAG: hypothetical protein KDM81_11610 [Verrucomicrobiae bacterium]|nr:hypothetical protein [Verrucomicrobiae bacterium]
MARQLRIEYPGAIYQVMSRGDWREDIFHDEVDRLESLKTLAEACQKADFQIHAYCPSMTPYSEATNPNAFYRVSRSPASPATPSRGGGRGRFRHCWSDAGFLGFGDGSC